MEMYDADPVLRFFLSTHSFCLLILTAIGGSVLLSAELTPRQIVDRAIETDRNLREKRSAYQYDFSLTTEKIDRQDKILSTRAIKATVRPSKEISYTIDITEDSEKKSGSAHQQEARKMEEAQQLMTKIELEKLVDQYEYRLEKSAPVLTRPVYLLRFKPRADYVVKSREEKVLHAITGRLWIDRETFAILKSEGTLSKPTAVAWFFATMREMNFEYQAAFLPNGDPVPASFRFFFDVQIPFSYQRERQFSTMQNYRNVE
jgi:hypothetical protein